MLILPLTSPDATLENAGGKGLNLVRLTRTGFTVPRGFIVSTRAYREFVEANRWLPMIQSMVTSLSADDATALERASARIRSAFSAGKMPEAIEAAIRDAYANLRPQTTDDRPPSIVRGPWSVVSSPSSVVPVAVRSSATTEDLPDLSFAGQQDTYLNIIGVEEVLQAVVKCWSSLWTARAIGYRIRNGIDHQEAALAVVVQEMVQSEASGVLFTANPLTGSLGECVIDATLGLGEALVSGQVEPDHYIVDMLDNRIRAKTLGAKKISTRGKAGGGVETVAEQAGEQQALSDDEILRLAAAGGQIQREYGSPQDIEWAFAGQRLYILQSRAITSLFPVPEVSFDPLIVWVSFGAVQGLAGPLTPLGIDGIIQLAAGASRMFGVTTEPKDVKVFGTAAERIWVRISDVLRHPLGPRVSAVLGFVEPSAGKIIQPLLAEPRLGAGTGKWKFSTMRRIAKFALPIVPRLVRNMLRPERARTEFDAIIESRLAGAQIPPAGDRYGRLLNVVTFMREQIGSAFQFLLPRFIPIFAPSIAALNLLNEIAAGSDPALVLEITRGLPDNITTEMDLALWNVSRQIHADAGSLEEFRRSDAPALARRYLSGDLAPAAQNAIAAFMERYGMRGVAEIDFGQPRWREDPAPIMHVLQSYLQVDEASAPDALFRKGQRAAEHAIEELAARARKQRGGWLKERMVRAAARRIRLLMGARESPKFFAVRTMGIGRKALLEVGREFVEAGTIERADDLVFLKLDELERMAYKRLLGERIIIATRRLAYARELRRRQVPRVLVSDGRAFYEGLGSETDTGSVITGSPVSPGVAEGRVHIILDPRGAHLAPGEILVCPGTDPAWTPLFMAAGGLITEVGGMMTHGSVVAREYGIPAVVGVHEATTRLKDGQLIRLDGTAGQIVVLSEP